ncbi:MAG: nucleoside-diphosphate sugar epimerase [Rhodoferax ferrireducens]|uniref:Nucleoside-diphosphate sugar epimerase n=1 Tax=Rhodoferax ferrireducens TaxID=192843 RepID=A0A1W9KP75_9BURK|nr:MAG: nucleoside-diphosphate sugar epimerase [Rhodoferax ferrireducens]
MATAKGRSILLAGASGLVGREILTQLLADRSVQVLHCVGRRSLALKHPKICSHVVDFAALPELPRVDECFIALGTTIKVAGSQAAFRAVDLDAVVAVATAAKSAGATKFGVISSMGADAKSSVFYNRIKGEMELTLSQMGLGSLVIARPSLLDGDRATLGQPDRAGERLGLLLARRLRRLIPANYRTVLAKDVARALIQSVKAGKPGVVTLLSGEMQGG